MMNRNDIIVIDPSVIGQSHLLVNTGFLILLASIYDRVFFVAEESHCYFIQKYMVDLESSRKIIYIPYFRNKQIPTILETYTRLSKCNKIFFLNLEYALFIKINLKYLFTNKTHLAWVLHSHLASINSEGLVALLKNKIKLFLMFKIFSKNAFVVCGSRIKRNYIELSKKRYPIGNIHAVFHPVGINPSLIIANARFSNEDANKVKINFSQGWHKLTISRRDLIRNINENHMIKSKFEIVNKNQSHPIDEKKKFFTTDYVDRINLIAQADLFLHIPSDSYSLQASGALMDCILSKTPIIGLKTDFSLEIEKNIGKFGFFFDSEKDLIFFLENSSTADVFSEIEKFKSNLCEAYSNVSGISLSQINAFTKKW